MEPTVDAVSDCQPEPNCEDIPSLETQNIVVDHDTPIKPEPKSPSPFKESINGPTDSTGQETKEETIKDRDSALFPNPSLGEDDKPENLRDDASYDAFFKDIPNFTLGADMQPEPNLPHALREANDEADSILTASSIGDGEVLEEEDSLFVPEQQATSGTDDEDTGRPLKRAKKCHRTILRNPREVFQARHDKMPDNKRFTLSRKKADLAKLFPTRGRRGRNGTKGRLSKKDAKRYKIPGILQSDAPDEDDDPQDDTYDLLDTSTSAQKSKKGYRKELMEKLERNPYYDQSRCKSDWNQMEKVYSRCAGYKVLTKNGDYWSQKGMKSSLHDHQVIGLDFMLGRECSEEAPFGGFLADDMGLGKTVQGVSTIVANPPTPEQEKKGITATLVVVPGALKEQWSQQIEEHTTDLHYGTLFYNPKRDNSAGRLNRNKVVVVSIGELMRHFPTPDQKTIKKWKKIPKVDLLFEFERWTKDNMDSAGGLHQVHWYRVIIDESHIVKNPFSKTSRAVNALRYEHPWLLGGTPIMNNYNELYSQLRFLKHPLVKGLGYTKFRDTYCNFDNPDCVQGISILLSDIFLRRTEKDKLFGQPIIRLPPGHKTVRRIDMHPAEIIIYQAVVEGLEEVSGLEIEEIDPRFPLQNPLVQLSLLRQITAGIELAGMQIMTLLTPEKLEDLQQQVELLKEPLSGARGKLKPLPNVLFDRLGKWKEMKESEEYLNFIAPVDFEECCQCHEPTEELLVIKTCSHLFCGACFDENRILGVEDDDEVLICPECGKSFKENELANYDGSKSSSAEEPKRSSKRGLDAKNSRPTLGPNQKYAQSLLQQLDARQLEFLPSSKLGSTLEQIQEWINSAPSDKIIIFTQFRLSAIMIGSMLARRNIKFIYFTGDKSPAQRTKATQMFKDNSEIKVMVAGLKCGGVGLNLTFANRVIIVDLWWNVCIEKQAFARVRRMGQIKDTHLANMVVNGTVDEAMVTMQEKKSKGIGAVMSLTEEDWHLLLGARPDKRTETSEMTDEAIEDDFQMS